PRVDHAAAGRPHRPRCRARVAGLAGAAELGVSGSQRGRKFPLRLDQMGPVRKTLVQNAAAIANTPTGLGLDSADVRRRMVERLKLLHDKARELMAPLRLANVRLVYGDGMLGHAPNAPYDGIIAAAGGDALPQAWLDQLAIGGRLVAPVRDGANGQVLVAVDRTEHGYERRVHEVVQFVPLKSGLVR